MLSSIRSTYYLPEVLRKSAALSSQQLIIWNFRLLRPLPQKWLLHRRSIHRPLAPNLCRKVLALYEILSNTWHLNWRRVVWRPLRVIATRGKFDFVQGVPITSCFFFKCILLPQKWSDFKNFFTAKLAMNWLLCGYYRVRHIFWPGNKGKFSQSVLL